MHPVTTVTNISGPAAALYAQVVSDLTAVRCAKCANVLPRSAFYKNSHNKNGLQKHCKQCIAEFNAKSYQRHRHNRHKKQKEWQKQNIEQHRMYQRQWKNKKYKNDVNFRLRCILRARILEAIKFNKGKKTTSSSTLLGCSIKFLRNHLEKQFQPGMTWENQGKIWHVDHVLPCASFDLTVPEQQRTCFFYKNLQPLWATDNLKKGAKLDYHADDEPRHI